MTLTPDLLLALLLLSALTTTAVTILRPSHARIAALFGMAFFTFAWLVARSALPLSSGPTAASDAWPSWSWQIGQLSWSISSALLLLTLGALALTRRAAGAPVPLLIQLLATVALLTCWAGNFATYVLTWTLLAGVWLGAVLWYSRREGHESPLALHTLVSLPLAAVLLLWLAAASAGPLGAPQSAGGVASWSTLTRALVLVAASYQLLVFPAILWRLYHRAPAPFAALLHAAPAAASALLLSRLESASDVGLAFALPFTLVGLLAIFFGARRAWAASSGDATLPVALILAQSGLMLLAAIWAGPRAMLAEASVLLLAGGVLLLTYKSPPTISHIRALQPGPLLALLALAALPLTAGFTGRSATYDAWLGSGRWLLVLTTALLHVPLLVAAFKMLLPEPASESAPTPTLIAPAPRPDVARLAALLLPALGLLSIAVLTQASLFAWLAILLPLLLSAVLAWRLQETAELRETLRDAFTLPLPPAPAWLKTRNPLRLAGSATREALSLLEGEGGLLWLLVFVVIIYLVR